MVDGEPLAGAGESGLDLIGDEDDVVVAAPLRNRRQEPFRGDDEASLALNRLDDHAGEVFCADLLLDGFDCAVGGFLARQAVAKRVGARHPVDVRSEGAEFGLVRLVLRRHGHGEVGASVVAAVEHHYRWFSGVGTRHLHSVFHRLCSGVEQEGLLGKVARGELVELLTHGDVGLVRRDHERGVGELPCRVCNRRSNLLVGRADRGHGDARGEVDERIAVRVHEHSTVTLDHIARQPGGEGARHSTLAASVQILALWPHPVGAHAAFLREVVLQILHAALLATID